MDRVKTGSRSRRQSTERCENEAVAKIANAFRHKSRPERLGGGLGLALHYRT
jgi:hypothetical protein